MRLDLDRFARDLLADCFNDVGAAQWRRRAAEFRAARPRGDDYPGQATRQELRERWHRLTAIAEACEARARFLEAGHQDWPDIEDFDFTEAA